MQINFRSYGTWALIITFLIGGLGAITGLVPASIASWITLITAFLGGILHSNQIAPTSTSSVGLKG